MRLTRTLASAACGITLIGSGLITATPSSANTDPEQLSILRSRGTADQFDASYAFNAVAPRALVRSGAANKRISYLVPRRLRYPSVGRNIAVSVVDVTTGKVLVKHRAARSLLPASNMKVVTAATALTTFGPRKRFETKVVSLGKGSVAIVGGGDATLGRTGISNLAAQTDAALRRNPELAPNPGQNLRVFLDDSLYPAATPGPGWRPSYQPYVVRPVRALGIDGDYSMDAARNAAAAFVTYLRGRGVASALHGRRGSAADAPVVGSYLGQSLGAQVKYMLQVSENNVAEMLYRNVAVGRGLVPTWLNSNRAARAVLKELGLRLNGLSLTSGSGVGRSDRLTAVLLTSLLAKAADRTKFPKLVPIYWGGLPVAGRTGTLKASNGRFNTRPTSCAAGRIRAKTGSLFDVISLGGLTVGRDGKLKAFAIIVNSRPQRFPQLATRRSIDRIAATVNGCY